jgi:hypothetical protein
VRAAVAIAEETPDNNREGVEVLMVGRILCTGAALSLAAFGFFANPVLADPLSPFGILLLLVSGVVWFGWDAIRDAYAYREEIAPNSGRAYLMTVRLGPVFVSRLVRKGTD